MPARRLSRSLAASLLALPAAALAGGYLTVDEATDTIYRWDASRPIVVNLDRGSLGQLSKQDADALALRAVGAWSTSAIPTCALSFSRGPDLDEDYGDGRGSEPAFNLNEGRGDGLTPVIYDQEGRLTATLFAGAELVIAGYAGPNTTDPNTGFILEGLAILNGRFIDGQPNPTDPPDAARFMEGVLVHEFGHMLNLDHAVFNDSWGLGLADIRFHDEHATYEHYPTMHSIIHRDCVSLELDDRSWISNLYPTAAFASKASFTGRVRLNDAVPGTLLDGVNVIARSADDPRLATSCVTGFDNGNPLQRRSGRFLIPGLDPFTRWTFEIEPIPGRFIGLSGVGTVDPPIVLPAPVEFINEAGVEGLFDRTTLSTTFLAGPEGSNTPGIDLQMNVMPPATVITEVDPPGPGAIRDDAVPITFVPGIPIEIRGNVDPEEGSRITINKADPFEDWYEVSSPAPFQLNRIRLTASTDMDLAVLEVVPALEGVASSLTIGSGNELIETQIDSSLFAPGNPTFEGKVYIGVSSVPGSAGGNYTLRLEGGPSPRAAVAISNLEIAGSTLTIRGRGFRAGNGGPFLSFPGRAIAPQSITVVSPEEVRVELAALPGSTEGLADPITVQIRNANSQGGYGGRLALPLGLPPLPPFVPPSALQAALDTVLGTAPFVPLADRNRDRVVDAADLDL